MSFRLCRTRFTSDRNTWRGIRNMAWMVVLIVQSAADPSTAEDRTLDRFERKQLTDVYYSEGANAGDLNRDGASDIVYGPYWFAGPDFAMRREIYRAVPQNVEGYADNFFNWIYDFNGDGWNDVLVAGFPGTPAYVYENPRAEGFDAHWPKHKVFDWVSNESPQFVNLTRDDRPELVCTRDGYFGYVSVNWEKPFSAWEFHPISESITDKRFGHGLGVGDVNGDGRMDLLYSGGWFEQPAERADSSRWMQHPVAFTDAYGGADMFAYDVDGDGDNDVITSLAAHHFGLAWYEQVKERDEVAFKQHLIVGKERSDNRYGVVFSELHSVNLVDIDGDGLKDIVTGKTYYSHHKGSPLWDAGAVVYWFRLVRTKEGVDWLPFQADGEAGIGRQLSIADVNGDALPDIVVGGMKGAHVLTHQRPRVDAAAWAAAQPKRFDGFRASAQAVEAPGAKATRGPKSPIDGQSGKVRGAIEGESLTGKTTGGNAAPQGMSGFPADRWSGGSHLWWTGGKVGDTLTIALPEFTGAVAVEAVLTCARDYGVVQLSLDDAPLGDAVDLYHPQVVTTGVLTFPKVETKGAKHVFQVKIVGAHPQAAKAFMFGLDYLRIQTADGKYVAGRTTEKVTATADDIVPKGKDGGALNVDFESGTLDGWTATGTAFADQPVRGDTVAARRTDMRSGHVGDFWIGGYERHGDDRTGTLTSPTFQITHPYASFYSNGGNQPETRVELVLPETGEVIHKTAGTNNETLRRVVVDLRTHLGKAAAIRLVDNDRGAWGHLNFDHFRFHEKRPTASTPLTEFALDEYPHAGLSAREAAAAMRVPEGFRVLVGAAEPDVQQPIAMAIDDRGRVWIAEAYEYPQRAKGDAGRDRILIFEDANGDGTLDSRKVFAEGLNLVSGLEVGFGGVWVGAAPYLQFIPDRDGDDVPDGAPQVLLDGWGYQDTHETLNSFIWGPDGWLYGCHGVFTHSLVGKPGAPKEQRVPINAGVWRYHPLRHEFEVFAHGTSNPWGVDFNDHGQAFITACVIPHLYHVIQGGRYQRQAGAHFNPHTYQDIVTIADHLHYFGATPHGGNNKSDAAGGGHAHAGAMIYLGDRWPASYRNQLFMNNIHGQRLNVDVLMPRGSGYVGGHGPDFLLTGDRASQILNLQYGPDGDAWMIDWYDMQACHTGNPVNHDRSNGRIYKICYGPSTPSNAVNLSVKSDEELAEFMLSSNDWHVRHARRLLQERGSAGSLSAAAIDRLATIATTHSDDARRLRAVWALHVAQQLNDSLRMRLLDDSSPYVRGWAVQLIMETERNAPSPETLARCVAMARSDASPVVRGYLASAAQRMPKESRWPLLEQLVRHSEDAGDHNLPLLYWYAAEPLAEADPMRALAFAISAGEFIPKLREFMLRRIGSSDAGDALSVLVSGLKASNEPSMQLTFLEAMRSAVKGQRRATPPAGWDDVVASLRQSKHEQVRLNSHALGVTFGDKAAVQFMRSLAANDSAGANDRLVALQALLDDRDGELVPLLISLLRVEGPLRDAAIRGMSRNDDPRVVSALLDAYAKLPVEQKRLALGALCSRASFAVPLLKAVAEKRLAGTDITADLVRQLQNLKHAEVNELLASVWGTAKESAADKLALMEQLKRHMAATDEPAFDVELGRALFAKTCQKCHILYGIGGKIGPDLTGSNRGNLDYLLSNIVDPSAVMAKEYRPTILMTSDGRVLTGLIKAEDSKTVTLQTSDTLLTIAKADVEERVESEQSMMPEDQLKLFSRHEQRSLIAYLQGKRQNAQWATVETASSFFNGRDLAGWTGRDGLWSVENGEIVGRTEGLKINEWLVSDFSAGDFELSLEVRLVDNAGNSGIQFRSLAREGDVSGYQADVGAGWWGKLYEEHGRALLWNESGERHVRSGDWNLYVIRAEGSKIRTFINGQPCVNLDDPTGAKRGLFALQLHSGGKTEVRFRNMKLTLLAVDSPPPSKP